MATSDTARTDEGREREGYRLIRQALKAALQDKDAPQARALIREARDSLEQARDLTGVLNAVHYMGRIEHEFDNKVEALALYNAALEGAEHAGCQEVIARARHERARIFRDRYWFDEAEEGFRYAIRYYKETRDRANCRAAVSGLVDLALSGLYYSDFFIPRLEQRGVPIGSPAAYLEVRSLAILSETSGERYYRDRLVGKAMATHASDHRFARYILKEAYKTARFQGDTVIVSLVRALLRQWRSPPCARATPRSRQSDGLGRQRKYTTPDTAATDIGEMHRWLSAEHTHGSFVYRGQTREYPGPLLPSIFRRWSAGSSDPLLTRESPLFEHSLRKIGQRFYGECLEHARKWAARAGVGVADAERQAVSAVYRQAMRSSFAARDQVHALSDGRLVTWEDALLKYFSEPEREIYHRYEDQWQVYIDSDHRRTLRNNGFIKPFGYLLGTTLAQQYGLSSEGLDATLDPDVAAFFATHLSERDYSQVETAGLGIIYRFPFVASDVRCRPLSEYNYYDLPTTTLDLSDVLYRFERSEINPANVREIFKCYYGATYREQLRDFDLLMLSRGSVALSRIAHQRAVIIFPDELRKDPGPQFHHTGELPASIAISREELWPRDDPFLEIIVSIMTGYYPLRAFEDDVMPHRLDLIDAGFDKDNFLQICQELALHGRPLDLVSDDEHFNSMNLTVTI
jgi:hypothetical protein